MTSSPAERAELLAKITPDVIEAFRAGLLTREEAREELKSRGEELGVYAKLQDSIHKKGVHPHALLRNPFVGKPLKEGT